MQKLPINGDLTRWANQGVLLLNDVLTVREGQAGSHTRKGWESFTQQIIEMISREKKGVVFMLWGGNAHKKEQWIDGTNHLILKSGHPSPLSANQGKWFGNRHFSQANEYLVQNGKTPINW
ncbi:uracil-DNA glycosylase [Capnocytophaga sp. ARDL2]|uniref:uracil-DNA glycosylase n=1 Tax=Capnocytophaga sp. ARDL2 TaxID=3238809 RepID=UPI00355627B3